MPRALRWCLLALTGFAALLFCTSGALTLYFAVFATCTDTADCKDVATVVASLAPFAMVSGLCAAFLAFVLLRSK